MPDETPTTIALAQETVEFGKRRVVTSRVRVRTETDVIQTVATGDLDGETIEITRVPVDAFIDAAPEIRVEGDLTILPVVEEVLVVEKRLVLVEEVHIRRVPTRQAVEIPQTLRRQRAVVERIDPETGEMLPNFTLNQKD